MPKPLRRGGDMPQLYNKRTCRGKCHYVTHAYLKRWPVLLSLIFAFSVLVYFIIDSFMYKSLKCNNYANSGPINATYGQILYQANVQERRFITFQYIGRLGNQMFQYASALGIAKQLGRRLVTESTLSIAQMILQESEKIPTLKDFIRSFDKSDVIYFVEEIEDNMHHSEKTLRCLKRATDKVLILYGYFQSWKYFHNYSDLIKSEFQVSQPIKTKVDAAMTTYRKGVTMVIGIHVRRGDMARNLNFVYFGYVVAKKSYLDKAMSYYAKKYPRDKIRFVLTSTNINWAKEQFAGGIYDIVFVRDNDPIEDLYLLTRCDHLIITVGTFGWWAGYLGRGNVVYQREIARKGSGFDEIAQYPHEYFMPNWQPL